MRIDIGEARLDFRDAVRVVGNFGFVQQCVTFEVGLENHLDQGLGAVRRLLCKAAYAPAWRNGDRAGFRRQFTADRLEQRRFADAIAANKPDAGTGHDLRGPMVDQKFSGNAD